MASLFDISAEFQRFYEIATEDEDAFADTLESLEFDLAEKSLDYIYVINKLEMEADKADEIAGAFRRKAEIRRNNIKRMKDAMLKALDAAQMDKIEINGYTIRAKNNGGVQPLKITGDVPDNMTRIEIKPDNTKIRNHLKEHPECEWAHLEPRGRHLEIK